ncbi:diguanylate cyclase (GGDEF) domain-containing protein [Modicisalibacter muralis]|uniref:diguanylate cyclase n=1 Tax=Modicisalibacter muralis TaxID=119000 RepID=A0A1G9N3A0_9GAMM|nr:diguanylate cyclase [Halomonas muralis]SDL80345.1 diguanylate cyclase (GGDEF) domain-containing protein [Halomonas muralis]
MHPTTMPELDRAVQYLDVLVWMAPDADMGWQVLMGNPKELLGLPPSELEHYAADADWPGLRCQDANLRQRLLLNARTQGEACSQYTLARNGRLEWLEERVVYRDNGWHGLIRRLPPSPINTMELPPALDELTRRLFESMPDRIFIARREAPGEPFRYVYGNPALLDALRLSPRQWNGHRPEDVFTPSVGQRLQSRYAECEQLGQPRGYDETMRRGHREHIWHTVLTRLDNSQDPAMPFLVGLARDHTELNTAKRSAANAHRRLRHLLETSPAVLYACDSQPPWTLNYISRNLSQLLGLDTDAERINLRERVHPDDEARLLTWLEAFTHHQRKRRALRYRLRHADGYYLTVQNEARVSRPVREGAAPELVGTLLDVSREAELLARLEIMTERIPGLIFQFRRAPGGQLSFPYLAGNDYLLRGLDPEALALDASPVLERIPEEDLTALMIAIERSVQRHTPLATQLRLHQPDGSLRWAAARAQPETCDDGSTLWHGVLLDISDQVAHEAHLRELSDTDDLTGLANRRRLMQRLDEELSRSRRHGSVLTLLLLDLDHFKRVNDTWGHLKGDQVLREIATLCRETLRHEDVVARFGGEEMAILLPLTPLEDGLRLAERLRQIIAGHDYGIQRGSVTASLGVAEYIDGDTTDTLIERADRGLYAAKHQGRNRVVSIK